MATSIIITVVFKIKKLWLEVTNNETKPIAPNVAEIVVGYLPTFVLPYEQRRIRKYKPLGRQRQVIFVNY